MEKEAEEESQVQKEETGLLEREILRLQEMVANSKREISMKNTPALPKPQAQLNDQQNNLSNLTSKLQKQLGELMKVNILTRVNLTFLTLLGERDAAATETNFLEETRRKTSTRRFFYSQRTPSHSQSAAASPLERVFPRPFYK